MRPVVRFVQGFPESLQTQQNEFYHTGDAQRGVIIFLGDEPHLDVERYIGSLLDAARVLGVKRIIGLGGVYGEVPYDKERIISCNYSMPDLKQELEDMAVTFSDYHGGASIGSYLCRRAGDQDMEYVGMYSFVPTYDFSLLAQTGSSIRIENDYRAWLGVMQRINYMLKVGFDLTKLQKKSRRLNDLIESKIEELENANPQLGVREYLQRLSTEFQETEFSPLDDVWKENLRELLDKFEPGEDEDAPPED